MAIILKTIKPVRFLLMNRQYIEVASILLTRLRGILWSIWLYIYLKFKLLFINLKMDIKNKVKSVNNKEEERAFILRCIEVRTACKLFENK